MRFTVKSAPSHFILASTLLCWLTEPARCSAEGDVPSSPTSEESNAWTYTYKDKGQPEADNGRETALSNPYWTRGSFGYSTPWEKEE